MNNKAEENFWKAIKRLNELINTPVFIFYKLLHQQN